jgi:hypothetical protein
MNLRTFVPTCGVYALVDPRTNRVMYVGQSVDIEWRYRQHCDRDRYIGNVGKRKWVKELCEAGLKPSLTILEQCECGDLNAIEKHFIGHYKANGEAELNLACGGGGSKVDRTLNAHPDEWHQLENEIMAARNLLLSIAHAARRLAGQRHYDAVGRAIGALDTAAWNLNELRNGGT